MYASLATQASQSPETICKGLYGCGMKSCIAVADGPFLRFTRWSNSDHMQ
jgi:hypothetical protein